MEEEIATKIHMSLLNIYWKTALDGCTVGWWVSWINDNSQEKLTSVCSRYHYWKGKGLSGGIDLESYKPFLFIW